ncbi:hypothetical protein PG994_005139 [Apiospora phragmitis]|uniref:Uncharacterized protein n=1 Tax=Apiospora phragmitis TaxID=2905665 RepID=A0ABR1VVM9_9PEZI
MAIEELQQQRGKLSANSLPPFGSVVPGELGAGGCFGLNDFNYIQDWEVEKHDEAHARDIAWLNAEVQSLEAQASASASTARRAGRARRSSCGLSATHITIATSWTSTGNAFTLTNAVIPSASRLGLTGQQWLRFEDVSGRPFKWG